MFMRRELFNELSDYAKSLIMNLDFDRLDKMRYVFNFSEKELKELIASTYLQKGIEAVKEDKLNSLEQAKEINGINEQNEDVECVSQPEEEVVTKTLRTYTLKRRVLGADLIDNETGENELVLREKFFHFNDFSDGDIVTLEYINDKPHLEKVGKADSTEEFRIGVFLKGILRKSVLNGTYYIEDNINGEFLSDYNDTEYQLNLGRDLPTLGGRVPKEGDTVDLAWELGKPASIYQRRWYFSEELPEKSDPKTVKKKEVAKKEESDTSSISLDYDLGGKKIGLVLGDGMRSGLMSFLVIEHGGVPVTIDAHRYQGDESSYKKKLKDCDAVVVAKDYVKHAVTKALRNVTKDLGIGYAMSNGVGFVQIEKAIYRAVNGLQVDEVGANIDYPML